MTSCHATKVNAEKIPLSTPIATNHGSMVPPASAATASTLIVTNAPVWEMNTKRRGDIRPAIAPAGRLNTALGIAYAAATAAAQKAEPVSSKARNPLTSVDIQRPTRETSSPANNVRILRFRQAAGTRSPLAQ